MKSAAWEERSAALRCLCFAMDAVLPRGWLWLTRGLSRQEGANSTEFDPATPFPAVIFMPEGSTTHKGGTMRLGSRRTILETVDCTTARLYQVASLLWAHRKVPRTSAQGMQRSQEHRSGSRNGASMCLSLLLLQT